MKALIVPDLPEWKRKRYLLIKMLKQEEVLMFPATWEVKIIPGTTRKSRIHNHRKYIAIKKR